ncbi:hypothetical protein ACFL1N_11155 [Thermodesulfobacteriota bacterium]
MPFELGRPLGVPGNASFQRKVLLDLISLLERTDGPFIIDDFPEDAPESEDEVEVLSCPVSYDDQDSNDPDPLKTKFIREILAMRPWYDMAVKKRERTTVGGSGMEIGSLGEFLYTFVEGELPENPRDDVDISVTLKLAAEDIKSYYVEGVTSQPGQEDLSSKALNDWFWNKTSAGSLLLELVRVCSKSDNEMIKMTGSHFIAPMEVVMKRGVLEEKRS